MPLPRNARLTPLLSRIDIAAILIVFAGICLFLVAMLVMAAIALVDFMGRFRRTLAGDHHNFGGGLDCRTRQTDLFGLNLWLVRDAARKCPMLYLAGWNLGIDQLFFKP